MRPRQQRAPAMAQPQPQPVTATTIREIGDELGTIESLRH
jgi:hypothetical protein